MMEHPDFATRDHSSLRSVLSGGSTVPADLVRRIESTVGIKFGIVFGQTEASPVQRRIHGARPGRLALHSPTRTHGGAGMVMSEEATTRTSSLEPKGLARGSGLARGETNLGVAAWD